MQIDEFTSTLEQRGFLWQAAGIGTIGVASVAILSVYSDSHHWIIDTYRIAATQLNWAFIAPIVATIERIRHVFETKTEIRQAAREQVIAKATAEGMERGREQGIEQGREQGRELGIEQGREQGRELGIEQGREQGALETEDRIRASLRNQGVQLTPEQENQIFNGHR